MQTYLVGGAVRDKLLNIPTHDRDWVVVGSTPKEMLALGFQQVGQDFPVFLHPVTHEEYALARTERKTAPGYKGFDCDSSASVTLEEDLLRRDLTINAIAESDDGTIVDPYGGQKDLNDRILRHVSNAFLEDPLRVLRVARFAARFHHLGFTVADETTALMTTMVDQGEVNFLTAERIWKETERALGEKTPEIFIRVLHQCHALKVVMPEIEALFGVPQPEQHHPEIDTGEHALLCLAQAAKLSSATTVRFASLIHDLGKALTPTEKLPQHIAHEAKGKAPIKALCKRIKAPNDCRDLALLACEYHTHCHRAKELKASTILNTLEKLDAFRRPDRFEEFLLVCEADARGRTGLENRDYPQADIFRTAFKAANATDTKALLDQGLQGKMLGEELRRVRIKAIATLDREENR